VSTGAARAVASARPRQRLVTTGTVQSVRVVRTRDFQPVSLPRLRVEYELDDGTGTVWLVFLGKVEIAGVEEGARLTVDGTVLSAGDRLTMLNPEYRFAEPSA
jgi:hypothetical protein